LWVARFRHVSSGFRGLDALFLGWEKWMTVCGGCGGGGRALGGPVVPSRRRRVADGGDARRPPLVADERERQIEK